MILLCSLLAPAFASATQPGVLIDVEGAIGPALSAHVVRSLEKAQEQGAPLVVLRIDTPGGLDASMRDIIKAILGSRIPVIGYVAPSGARAASAGTYLLYAVHIAAMAPATNLGAATPVAIGGVPKMPTPPSKPQPESSDPESGDGGSDGNTEEAAPEPGTAMERKAVNDAVAYIRSLAEQRGRNADWAELAVRSGASLSANEALKQNVIDLIAEDLPSLLAELDGRTLEVAGQELTLATADLPLNTMMPDWRTELLGIITNPTVAYLLLMIGIYGLILEGYSPGAMVPGVVGAICLLLGLFALQLLPVNYTGLALIILGVILMIAEGFVPSFGVLGFGGVVAFVIGSIMLMDTDVPGYQVPLALIAGIATAFVLVLGMTMYLLLRSRGQALATGRERLIGATGEALEDFHETAGTVWLQGESWSARSDRAIRKGQQVHVTGRDGLILQVRPDDNPQSTGDPLS